MIIDAHLHCSGVETTADVLQALDAAQIDCAVLLAPFLSGAYSLQHAPSLRAANQHLARLTAPDGERLLGFAVVNPLHTDAVSDLDYAIQTLKLRGLKLVPSGWYPYDDCAHRIYEHAERLDIPILFHSGIFIDGRSGRFCRPVFYEAVREHPKLRVCLAHLGWPWCDEANAVGVIDLINGVPADSSQFRFDISFGPPAIYRAPVMRNAIAVVTAQLLQFGSDCFLPCSSAALIEKIDAVHLLLDELQICANERSRIMAGTAAAWLGVGYSHE